MEDNLCKIGFDIIPFDAVSNEANGYSKDKFRLLGKGRYVKLKGVEVNWTEECYFFIKNKRT
jgi:hypothetical protein